MSARDSGRAIRPDRSLTSHSGLLILDRDGQQETILPPQSRTTSTAATPPSVLLVLSASMYPIPKAQSQNLAVEDRVPPYGGLFVNEQKIENDDGHFTPQPSLASLSSLVQNNSPKRDLIKPGDKTEIKPAPKRGRPRKIVNLDDAGSNEVGFSPPPSTNEFLL